MNAQYCVSVMMWHLEVHLIHAPEAMPLKGVLTCGHKLVLCHSQFISMTSLVTIAVK